MRLLPQKRRGALRLNGTVQRRLHCGGFPAFGNDAEHSFRCAERGDGECEGVLGNDRQVGEMSFADLLRSPISPTRTM